MDDLEKTIADLVERKNAAPRDSSEHAFYERQLRALRYSREEAGDIIEGADPMDWGCYCRPLAETECPEGWVLPLHRPARK